MIEALEMFRAAKGDLAGWDYAMYVGHFGMGLSEAAKEILTSDRNDDQNIQRVEAMRQSAATARSRNSCGA